MPRAAEIAPDWKLLAAVIAIAIAGAIAMGLAAVLHGRPDALRVAGGGGSRVSADRSGVMTRKMLVVFQLTSAVVLVTSTVSVLHSFWRLLHVDVGFDRSRLITMRVSLPSGTHKTGGEIGRRFEKIASSVRSVPGVRQAAAVNMLPVAEWGINGNVNVEGMRGDPILHRGQTKRSGRVANNRKLGGLRDPLASHKRGGLLEPAGRFVFVYTLNVYEAEHAFGDSLEA